VKRYLVEVKKGQNLAVEIPSGADVSVDVRYPNGKLIPDASGAKSWQAKVTRDGEYQIDAIAQKQTDFTLNVTVGK
jgi:serine/threonine-protein kinase